MRTLLLILLGSALLATPFASAADRAAQWQ
jgi:hypothetical protein